ncbi:ATP-binding protein [Echinicola jeungdonensis]|uniref:histidine kinase n=1 Tax=Echinicola jeungdonensis TaxID=709343 RepID=A0ABV5J8G7_9BACT|nr:ATP-binding protein [Echinicola jeungdonensis]MDN3669974.1 ATP-binding protein [Echinicola jeungdonensis]
MKIRLLFFLFFLFANLAFSQSFQANKQINGLELPINNAFRIGQDNKGRMWFSTPRGIYFSDGINTYGLPEGVLKDLEGNVDFFIDAQGIVWVYEKLPGGDIYFSDSGKWEKLKPPSKIKGEIFPSNGMVFNVVGEKAKKNIFLGFYGKLVFSGLSRGNWESIEYSPEEWGVLKSVFYNKGKFYLFFSRKTSILENGQLQPFKPADGKLPGPVYQVVKNKKDNMFYFLGENYLAKGKQLSKLDTVLTEGFSKKIHSKSSVFGLQERGGQIYFFFNSHLFKYSPINAEIIEVSAYEALGAYYIQTAFVDRENIIWISSDRGVVNIPTLRFQNFNAFQGLLENDVAAIKKLGYRKFLFGFNNGIQIWERGRLLKSWEWGLETGDPSQRVMGFSQDHNGVVWAASCEKGVGRLDLNSRKLEFFSTPGQAEVVDVCVKEDSIFINCGNKVYQASIYDRGKDLFKNEITKEIFEETLQGKVDYLRKIEFLTNGKAVFLARSNPGFQDQVIVEDQFLLITGYDMLEFDDTVVLGSEHGLKYYRSGEIDFFKINGQIIDRPVYDLVNDKSGNLWAGTDKGVYLIGDGVVRRFDKNSGLIGDIINSGAFTIGDYGRVAIGTKNGLSLFIPEEDEQSFAPPLVSIKKVQVIGSEEGTSLEKVPYSQNNIQIDYQAISFLEVANLTVEYKLEGFHDTWQKIRNPRTTSLMFNNLPPGEYQLRLKASLGGQFESETVISEPFHITKPYFLQFWFIGLVLLVFLLIGFVLNTLVDQMRTQGLLRSRIDEKIKEIKAAEKRFRSVWDNSKDGLMLSVQGGEIVAANPSLLELVGEIPEKGGGNNIRDLFSDPQFFDKKSPEILSKMEASNGKGVTLEMEMPFYSGKKDIEIFISWMDVLHQGEKILLTVMRDVTEKKAYERRLEAAKNKAEEANKVKSNFLSSMSHEIRTPLNGILGSTETIMSRNQDNQELVGQLQIILESGERLLQTINSILDMSKIEANKMEVIYEKTQINDFLSKILLPLKNLAIKNNLLLTAKFETKALEGKVDRRFLEMIVNNIVGNAIKYSPEGLIRFTARQEKNSLLILVQDNGIGMSEDFVKNIFNPFEQESVGYDRKFEGTGLGLSITKNLVTILGGEITIQSKPKEGTLVRVILPIY